MSTEDSDDFEAELARLAQEASDTATASPNAALCQRLRTAWFNEKIAPEVLPFEAEAVFELHRAIAHQDSAAKQALSGDVEAQTKYIYHLYQMELARLKYLLTSYLRVRLWKIEQQALYLHSLPQAEKDALLSPSEVIYLKGYAQLLIDHQKTAFLSRIPDSLYAKDDFNPVPQQGGCLSGLGAIVQVFAKFNQNIAQFGIGENDTVKIAKGDVWIMRYEVLRPLIRDGRAKFV